MTFHEVPKNDDPLNVSLMERVVMCPISIAMNNLLALVTSRPLNTVPPIAGAIHMCWIVLACHVAVHMSEDICQMIHLDVIVETIACNDCSIRPSSEIVRSSGRVGNGSVIETMHVNNADRMLWHGVVTSERRAAHWSNAGQTG